MKKKVFYDKNEIIVPSYKKVLIPLSIVWFVIQIALPLRHWTIPGDVLWTEEGHRLSWRMMLRGRSGITNFYLIDNKDPKAKKEYINKQQYLSKKQIRSVNTKPDFMWQFAQYLKKKYAEEGKDISVYVKSSVSVNGKKRKKFIDPEVDLANVPWNYFKTNPWILKYDSE
ncbi:hypothetical protein GCM10022258_30170 [Aquimarina gracilis]